MKILVTGAFGNVGKSTITALMSRGHQVRVLEQETRQNRRTAHRLHPSIEVHFGDILNIGSVFHAVRDIDAVIHLAAVIPPEADRNPDRAGLVNIEGTRNILHTIEQEEKKRGRRVRLIFASSVAVYGDRRENPYIRVSDELKPNGTDFYAATKVVCEGLIRNSPLDWTILRLSYIADYKNLKLDPLMFDMPLNTQLEICDTRDAGLAFAEAAMCKYASGKILHIAGGKACRTSFEEYLRNMFSLMGLGSAPIPPAAFSRKAFHCGFMDTEESEGLLRFQHRSLTDFYGDVKQYYASKRFFIRILQNLANKILYLKSPYFLSTLRKMLGQGLTKTAIYFRYLCRRQVHI